MGKHFAVVFYHGDANPICVQKVDQFVGRVVIDVGAEVQSSWSVEKLNDAGEKEVHQELYTGIVLFYAPGKLLLTFKQQFCTL